MLSLLILQDYPPYFDTGSTLCNNLHAAGAKCTGDLSYDLFDGVQDDSTECSFIESIRFGTYDANGQLTTGRSFGSWDAEVTDVQLVLLIITASIVVCFVVYACYLHHAMTNLLIKSLSHRELLPPSRHNRRRNHSPKMRGSNRSAHDEPDWHHKPV